MRPITPLSILYSPESDKTAFIPPVGDILHQGAVPLPPYDKKCKKMLTEGPIVAQFSPRLYLPAIQILPWHQLVVQFDLQEETHLYERHSELLIIRTIRHSRE